MHRFQFLSLISVQLIVTSGIGIGFLSHNARNLLDLEVELPWRPAGNGEVISQPKVVTSDKETAKILKGSEVPYQEASSSGATSTSFKEAALALEVTPQITHGQPHHHGGQGHQGRAGLSSRRRSTAYRPSTRTRSTPRCWSPTARPSSSAGCSPTPSPRPWRRYRSLGDFPFIGRLFRRDMRSRDQKSELLVFITPRIMNNQAIAVSN